MSPLTRPAQDLNWLVTNFVERVPSVAHAIVVSSDGLPMAYSQGFPADRVDQAGRRHLRAHEPDSGRVPCLRGRSGLADRGGNAAGPADRDGDQ